MYRIQQDGPRRGHKELEPIGYNIDDQDFWDKCWLWQKDTVGSHDLYPFQVYGYHYIGNPVDKGSAAPFEPPSVAYPKEIRDLFPGLTNR